uniref:Uncharacterized protein n=1 Tax=Glossina pallidipes TaxID=7398 RepID=A0A1A9ZMD2_GLOPL
MCRKANVSIKNILRDTQSSLLYKKGGLMRPKSWTAMSLKLGVAVAVAVAVATVVRDDAVVVVVVGVTVALDNVPTSLLMKRCINSLGSSKGVSDKCNSISNASAAADGEPAEKITTIEEGERERY